MKDFGLIIKERRTELGLTLEQVGQACGVGKSTVRKWETGMIQNVRRDKIKLIAHVLRLDPTLLIDMNDDIVNVDTSPAESAVLSADEAQMLRAYRDATPEARRFALDLLNSHKKVAYSDATAM